MKGAATLLVALVMSCTSREGDSVVVARVRLSSDVVPGRVASLRVTAEDADRTSVRDLGQQGGLAITFPSSFSLQIPRKIKGPLRLDIRALDAATTVIARAVVARVDLRIGKTVDVDVVLDCFGTCLRPLPDAGLDPLPDPKDAAPADAPQGRDLSGEQVALCGNGRLDRGEVCDELIAVGLPGACPKTCDDGIACTTDTPVGDRCSRTCVYTEVLAQVAGDMCCPADATSDTDPDCSSTCANGSVEPGEACDKGITVGRPGACPAASSCVDMDRCTTDVLISANTCSARCTQRTISAQVSGDGCCPTGAASTTDTDCPVVCGNGILEPPEVCDTAIDQGRRGACPISCDDKNACTTDLRDGAGCQAVCRSTNITEFRTGDLCCPPGGSRSQDGDCPSICGNGALEPGETCDRTISEGNPGACIRQCAAPTNRCLANRPEGTIDTCSARCTIMPTVACSLVKDGCCAGGCSAANDADCSPSCGNGTVEAGETCDTAIADGKTGACPKSCTLGPACTSVVLVSAATCQAACETVAVTVLTAGDRCCPVGANANVDSDCTPICGNDVVESPRETCDRAIAPGQPGACPQECPPVMGCIQNLIKGTIATCDARCVPEPIRACQNGDGCCAPGCNRQNDSDCAPVCGNGVVEQGESCDKTITAGNPGACAAICDDKNACTTDISSGRTDDCTRVCGFSAIKACAANDKCCPAGCTQETDRDCAPAKCGNDYIEAGETCDPPASCPTICPDDGDLCTTARLTGDPATCNAVCTQAPITTCSITGDKCCPTGCAGKDADCPTAKP